MLPKDIPVIRPGVHLDRRLAEGGFGEVWSATLAGHDVVVKLGARHARDIEHEFAVLSSLGHPHLVEVLDYGATSAGRPFLVEARVDGPDLRDWWGEGRSVDELCAALAATCHALAYLHGRHVLHGDLKPSNILLEGGHPDGLRLIDFGLATSTDGLDREVSGTLAFLAPEVLRGEGRSVASDVFALGACLAALPGDDALEALRGTLMADDPAARPASARAVLELLSEVDGNARWAISPRSALPVPRLHGRDAELGRLDAAVQRFVSDGHGSLLVLSGPRGAGKSALKREVARRARLAGITVAGTSRPRGVPFATGAIDPILADLGVTPPPRAPSREALSSAVARDLLTAATSPTLLLVDELGGDGGFEEAVLAFVLASARESASPIAILVVSTEPGGPALERLRGVADGRTVEIRLGPIDAAALGALVQEVAGVAPPSPWLAALAEESRGLPGRAVRALARLWTAGELERLDVRWPSVVIEPGTPAERGSLEGFDPTEREIVEALALIPRPASPPLLTAAVGHPIEPATLSRLMRRGWVQAKSDAADLWLGDDDLAAAARARCEPARRAAILARAAAWAKEHEPGTGRAAALSFASGDEVGGLRAFLAAADRARDAQDLERASRLFRRAAEIAPSDPRGFRGVAVTERRAGRFDRASEALARWSALCPDASEPRLERAQLALAQGDNEAALAAIEGLSSVEALALQARARLAKGLSSEALALCEGAESETPELHHVRGLCHYADGGYDAAADAFEQARAAYAFAGDSVGVIRTRNSLAMADAARGDLQAAAEGYRACQRAAAELGDPRLHAIYAMNGGTVLQLRGQLSDALDAYRTAVRDAHAIGAARIEACARCNLASLLVAFRAIGPTLIQIQRARPLIVEHAFEDLAPILDLVEAEARLHAGDAVEAARILAAVAPTDERSSAIELDLLRARVAFALGDRVTSAAAAQRALEGSVEDGAKVTEAQATYRLGLVADSPSMAKERLRRAAGLARELGALEVEWRARFALCEHLVDEERAAGIRDALRVAREAELAVPPGYRESYVADAKRVELEALAPRSDRASPSASGLLELTRELVGERELDELLAKVLDHALAVAGAERSYLLLRRDGALEVEVARYFGRDELRGVDPPLSRSVASQVCSTGSAVLTTDAAIDDRFRHHRSVKDHHLRSIACVPLRMKGEILGALYVDSPVRRNAFRPDDVDAIQAFADQASLAIVNAQLHAEVREQRDRLAGQNRALVEQNVEIEAQKRELAALVAERTDALTQATERLRQVGDDLTERYRALSLIGSSAQMRAVFELVERVGRSELSVLIQGESGTGKELIAKALHARSHRAEGPLVSVNCAAIPGTLLESELFGHARGAFSGAVQDRAGLFEVADGGTLFLDEIGDMPLELQSKLLRVLQERRFRRVGEERERSVSVRVVSATHRDLSRMVEQGTFRSDLRYRLEVVTIDLPPLRERREDIPELIAHFVSLHAPDASIAVRPSAMRRLIDHAWPGNVRELSNEIQRAIVLSEGDIGADVLSTRLGSAEVRPPASALKESLAALERELIGRALDECQGNMSSAARALGVDRAVLYRKVKRLGIESTSR